MFSSEYKIFIPIVTQNLASHGYPEKRDTSEKNHVVNFFELSSTSSSEQSTLTVVAVWLNSTPVMTSYNPFIPYFRVIIHVIFNIKTKIYYFYYILIMLERIQHTFHIYPHIFRTTSLAQQSCGAISTQRQDIGLARKTLGLRFRGNTLNLVMLS